MNPTWDILQGDCIEAMRGMESESVHCCITSPPYWSLRDYGVDGAYGLEPTLEEYIANMVTVFREVRRVLRKDGTLWLNLGDAYASNPSNGRGGGSTLDRGAPHLSGANRDGAGLKPKDLIGLPWRVAFALQADGWYLRSDIVWHKPNPMPESVTDRPTRPHEYVFLLTKSARYFYDADSIREDAPYGRGSTFRAPKYTNNHAFNNDAPAETATNSHSYEGGRNARTVWSIATQPYSGAHFATFPEKLVEPCILAGTSERGVCGVTGDPWERRTERNDAPRRTTARLKASIKLGQRQTGLL